MKNTESAFAVNMQSQPEFVQKTDDSQIPSIYSPYHCTAEWHLARLRPICALIHSFALHIGHESKRFACSAVSMAEYFEYNEATIREGFQQLEKLGFFEKMIQGTFNASVYRVFNHEEWTMKHPDQCVIKLDPGWKDDPLGQRLHVASGMRVKWYAPQIGALRKVGLTDEQIVAEFERYYELEGQRKKSSNVPKGFIFHLRNRPRALGPGVQ